MQDPNADLKTKFREIFGLGADDAAKIKIHVIRAPGRVNLIGEHTDYNDGFVLPMAIEPEVRIACRARNDGRVRLASTAFAGEIAEFSVDQKITPGEPRWANYSKGVAAELVAAGIPLVGMTR
jgi:galactokinase